MSHLRYAGFAAEPGRSRSGSYGALVVVALVYGALVGSLLAELLDDSAILFTLGIGVGTAIGSWLGLLASWRARRRTISDPWDPAPPVALDRYLAIGGAVGAAIGLMLVAIDALMLS